MQDNKLVQQNTNLIVWQSHQSNKKYLHFRQKIKKIHPELLSLDNDKQYEWFKILYNEIASSKSDSNYQVCKDQEQFIETLKCIQVFGVGYFLGKIKHECSKTGLIYLRFHYIQNICFRNLSVLNLWGCDMNSIQAISRMDIKNITYIILDQNNITSLKQFSKGSFPTLKFFYLSCNPYVSDSYKHLHRLHICNLNSLQIYKKDKIMPYLKDRGVHLKLQVNQQRWYKQQYLKVCCNKQTMQNIKMNKQYDLIDKKWKQSIQKHSLIRYFENKIE